MIRTLFTWSSILFVFIAILMYGASQLANVIRTNNDIMLDKVRMVSGK